MGSGEGWEVDFPLSPRTRIYKKKDHEPQLNFTEAKRSLWVEQVLKFPEH
jgi:hypothetical protein